MNRPDAFAQAAEEHRQAVATCAAAIRSVAAADWERAPAEKKWTPAQIAEHLAVAYDPVLSEIDGTGGFRMLAPWWMRPILRWKFLAPILAGTLPEGRSGAPGGPPDHHVPDTRGWSAPARRTRRGFPRPVRAGSRAGPRARHASVPRPARRRRGRAVPDVARSPPPRAAAIAGAVEPGDSAISSPHDRKTQTE